MSQLFLNMHLNVSCEIVRLNIPVPYNMQMQFLSKKFLTKLELHNHESHGN